MKFFKKLTKKPTESEFYQSRHTNHYDRVTAFNPAVPQTERFDNKLERYARFLELRFMFDAYDRLSPEERKSIMANKKEATIHYEDYAKHVKNLDQKVLQHQTGHTAQDFIAQAEPGQKMTCIELGECGYMTFGSVCHTTPCACAELYTLYKELCKEFTHTFGKINNFYPSQNIWLDGVLYEMKYGKEKE